jgi:CBS-domain-containing membrane protein
MMRLVRALLAIGEIGAGKKDVVTICVDELAMEAFKLLEEKKVSALAVVNNDGQLVGEMDSNSLKMIGMPACAAATVLGCRQYSGQTFANPP